MSKQASCLSVVGASIRFGGLKALDGVDLEVTHGEIHGLIGPNGAGKTTFFNTVTGLNKANSGSFALYGKPYTPHLVYQVAQAGIARTFQNIRLFGSMTALENVMVGRHLRTCCGVMGAILRTRRQQKEEKAIRQAAFDLLRYVGIERYADDTARNLSYGHQRRLEIARALATDPKLLALDEPAAGMNATEKVELARLLKRIRGDGRTILLIEHDVKLLMDLCDSITVLDHGCVISRGKPSEVKNDPKVIEAYLGTGAH